MRQQALESARLAAEQAQRAAAIQQQQIRPASSPSTSAPTTSTSNSNASKSPTTSKDGNGSNGKSADKSKDRDDDDDDSKGNRNNASIAIDEPPPSTLKQLFDKWTGAGNNGQGKGNGDDNGNDNGQGAKVTPKGPVNGTVTGAVSNNPPKTASTHVPVRGRPDYELLTLGSFKPHEVLAANLNASAAARAQSLGFKAGGNLNAPGQRNGVLRLIIPPGLSEAKALAMLHALQPDAMIGPNHVYRITPAADDEANGKTANAKVAALDEKSQAPCAGDHCFARDLIGWKPQLKSCARNVKVGLIDTSFDVAHPAFAGRRMKLSRFAGDAAPSQADWHGTAVLSVLAGDTASATPGLVPDAEFLLASTFGSDKEGNAVADSLAVLKALAWLDAEKANVVNMSFSGPANELIEAAIVAMAEKGVIFVAAAGNRGVSGPASYPAAYEQVIAVTAVGKNKQNYRHANRGDYVDVSAPGVDVWAALPGAKQGYRTGTSFAAPFVTGLLAAMPAARKNIATKRDVLSRVTFQDLGEPGRDPVYGEGLPLAPKTCNEIGGIASLPWSQEAKRMSVGGPKPQAATPAAVPATYVRPAAR